MKVLIITPMYAIEGRKNLFHDSSAVHYLVKHWTKECEVLVIYTYFNSIKSIHRYLNKNERKYHSDGYNYCVDGVNVEMIETQLLLHQNKLNKTQINRLKRKINEILLKNNFKNPDKLITHIPCYKSIQFIEDIDAKEKIAVLHQSDMKSAKKNSTYIEQLEKNFSRIYTRSKTIYDFFKSLELKNLMNEIIYSGVPYKVKQSDKDILKKDKENTKILYVGKLIKRKNLDLIINALSKIRNEAKFEFLIIGKGKEYRKILKLINKLRLQDIVKIIPELSRENVMEYMNESDIFIMPSVNETLGLVYLEAMSQGCITIGTIGEGIDGIIKNEVNGMLISPTVQEIENVLKKILKFTREEIEQYSINAITTAQNFDEEKMGMLYYENIVKTFGRN